MSERFGYIHSLFDDSNLKEQKFSLIVAGINQSNIFVDCDETNNNIAINKDLFKSNSDKQSLAWSELINRMSEGDKLFINNLSNLLTEYDMNLHHQLSSIQDRLKFVVGKNIQIISLGDELIINRDNVSNLINVMNATNNVSNKLSHDNMQMMKIRIRKRQENRKGRRPRMLGSKSTLYKSIYSYIKEGHSITEASHKFNISVSTAYRIKRDFNNMKNM